MTLAYMAFAFFCPTSGAIQSICESEFMVRQRAAQRNDCGGEDFKILLAIRKAENGGPGKEMGIKHPKAWGTDLDTQAGWAAATIVNNRKRWLRAGRPCNFITWLARRYCPASVDPVGHINWIENVYYWKERL